ncbi:hypothetical protein ACMFWY_06000 [Roseiconus sp. JC912]|uniref:hypothetical protein n=1 Tax=Roseiconus sp. JC912 TaxID=3396307 RepID=UPI003A4C626E
MLIWCVGVPALIASLAFIISWRLQRPNASSVKRTIASMVLGIGWWSAIAVSLSARQDWQTWPSEYWHHCLRALLLWPAISWMPIGTDRQHPHPDHSRSIPTSLAFALLTIAAAVTAVVCLPRGDAWQDTYSSHGPIGVGLVTCMILNTLALDAMSRRGTERWVLLVALASLGGPIALAASTYASLTEWGIAMASATTAITAGSLLVNNPAAKSSIGLILAASSSLVAAGRFQTYEDHPLWLYALLWLLPSLIATIDYFIKSRKSAIRITVSAIIASAAIATSVWYLLIRETEQW